MSNGSTVGDLVAAVLEANGVETAFGVISIHNMPMLDAIGRRNRIRFVSARGEAGAVNMADAAVRASGKLAAAFTSTGTGAGNAAGALIEAQTAGIPVLHLTGQIETTYNGRGAGYIHEAVDQFGMLTSVSKAAYHIGHAGDALSVLHEAVVTALTPPMGPVSIEIPIDVQQNRVEIPDRIAAAETGTLEPPASDLDRLAEQLAAAKRPLLWLGAGARHATAEVRKLADLGFAVITSTQGRGILPESDPASLGAFTTQPAVEVFFESCDFMLVAGSRLRGNETLKYKTALPNPRWLLDVDPAARNRGYDVDGLVQGDVKSSLAGLAERLEGRLSPAVGFADDIAATRGTAEAELRTGLGPYGEFVDHLSNTVGQGFAWVRDITISNTAWGNKLPALVGPRQGIHAVGGGIGQGLPMAIGASIALNGVENNVVAMIGDGGLQLCLGELATAVDEKANMLLLVMNDKGYGVIQNIQKVHYGNRQFYSKPLTPEFADVCAAIGLPHRCVSDLAALPAALTWGLGQNGPAVVEVDMTAIGPFAKTFAGPPVRN